MKFHFLHENFNVLDLEKSIKFYEEALGLKVEREKFAEDGSYKIVYLGDGITNFQLELTWLADRTDVVFVNDKMGIYFITDPDGYWIEILPPKK